MKDYDNLNLIFNVDVEKKINFSFQIFNKLVLDTTYPSLKFNKNSISNLY
jgi:hypothetical protein